MAYLTTEPQFGDTDNILLAKILQRLGGLATFSSSDNDLLFKILTSLNQADAFLADDRYVNVTGDTMTGQLQINSGTLTESSPALQVTQTWDNAGVTFSALKLNVTNTASNASSLLLEMAVDGTVMATVNRRGSLILLRAEANTTAPSVVTQKRGTSGDINAAPVTNDTLGFLTAQGWNGTAYVTGATLEAQAAENFSATASSALWRFRTPAKGSTTLRTLYLLDNAQILYTPIWNDVATSFFAYDLDVTDTNSAIGSRFLRLRTGSVEKFSVDKSGSILVQSTQVVSTRKTGWTAATGTATRTSFDTATVTTAQLAERVKALLDDLISHGLIGT